MKSATKFMKMFRKLPERARSNLILRAFTNPMTLNVVALEVRNDTKLGKQLLWDMGYEDD